MNDSSELQPTEPDYQPLTSAVTHADREAYLKETNGNKATEQVLWALIGIFVVAGMLILGASGSTGGDLVVGILWLLVAGVVVGVIYRQMYQNVTNTIRAARFAAANGFSFIPGIVSVEQTGAIWTRGYERHDLQLMTGVYSGREFECGTHVYSTGAGRDKQTHEISFMRVTLPRELPHVLIDARRNVIDVGEGIDHSQKLSLEGDFDKYFTVYCPDDYQQDVLYFLTPELMELMIEHDQAFDMEVVGNQLYFYRYGRMRYDQATIQQLFQTLARTGGEFAENTRLYKDDRAGAINGNVAPAGTQFKHHWTIAQMSSVALIVFYIVVMVTTAMRPHQ